MTEARKTQDEALIAEVAAEREEREARLLAVQQEPRTVDPLDDVYAPQAVTTVPITPEDVQYVADLLDDEAEVTAANYDEDDDDLGPDEDDVDEQQIALAINTAIFNTLDEADEDDLTGTPFERLAQAEVTDLASGGWLTSDAGVEVRLPNGDTFLVTVKYAGRR